MYATLTNTLCAAYHMLRGVWPKLSRCRLRSVSQALLLPDVDDPTSAAHQRVYKLALTMRRNFGIKLTLNSRVFRDSRQVDLRAAAEQDAAAPDAEKVLLADTSATALTQEHLQRCARCAVQKR